MPYPPTQLSKAASGQRGTHTKTVRSEILQHLQPSKDETIGIDIPSSLSQEERGLENHTTARFLIPRQHLDAFEEDPERCVACWVVRHTID